MWELFPEGRIHKQQRSRGVISLKIFFPSTRKQELKSWWAYIFLRYYWCLLTIKHLIRAHTISSQTVMKGILFQLLLPLYGKCFFLKIFVWSCTLFHSICLLLLLTENNNLVRYFILLYLFDFAFISVESSTLFHSTCLILPLAENICMESSTLFHSICLLLPLVEKASVESVMVVLLFSPLKIYQILIYTYLLWPDKEFFCNCPETLCIKNKCLVTSYFPFICKVFTHGALDVSREYSLL